MSDVIIIDVVSNSDKKPETIDLDDKPLGITYPMNTVSERQYACRKYHRWLSNSIQLRVDRVVDPLNNILQQAVRDKHITLMSVHADKHSHVDSIVDYINDTLNNQGYIAIVQRTEVQP